MNNAKQVVVIVGEKTKNLYKYVRWEIELALEMGLPIVVVNLNDKRELDSERCPPLLREACAVHVPFRAKIIEYALENFPEEYSRLGPSEGPRRYSDRLYRSLEIP